MGKRDDPVNSQEMPPGFAELEARYARLAIEEPPALLDQAVLNLARREAAAGHDQRRTAFRWIGALSTVSVLVLTVSLVTQQERGAPQSPGVQSRDGSRLERSKENEQQITPAASPQLLDESSASPAPVESTRAAGRSVNQTTRSRRQVRPDPVVMQKSVEAEEASALPAESDTVELERTDSDERKAKKEDLSADPAAWLQHILQLQQDGRDAEVADQLRLFQEIYPDYPLPDLLQD